MTITVKRLTPVLHQIRPNHIPALVNWIESILILSYTYAYVPQVIYSIYMFR